MRTRRGVAFLVCVLSCFGCSSRDASAASDGGPPDNDGANEVRWQASIANAEIVQMAGLPDGGVVIAGVLRSSSAASAQLTVRVLNPDGSERWSQSIAAGRSRTPETGPPLAVDAEGRIYLLLGREGDGTKVAIGDQALQCSGSSCLGLASFDAGGDLRWLVPIDVALDWHWMTATDDGVVLGLAFGDSGPILIGVGEDGGQRWQVPWPLHVPAPYALGRVTAGAGRFLAGDREGGFYVVGSRVCAAIARLSADDGSTIWTQEACGDDDSLTILSDAVVMGDGTVVARAQSRDADRWPVLAFEIDGQLSATIELPFELRPAAADADTAYLAPISLGAIAGIGQGGDARFQWPGTLADGAIAPHPSGLCQADVAPAPDGDLYVLSRGCASARALLGAPPLHESWTDPLDSEPYYQWLLARVRVPDDYQPRCGNGLRDLDEACDGDDFDNPQVSADGAPRLSLCSDWLSGGGQSGTAQCTSDCEVDLSACDSSCGNGMLDENEDCDGDLFRGAKSCDEARLGSGPLACSQCRVDLSVCPMRASCGNGMREEWEACDGLLIDPEQGPPSCQEIGLTGTITCVECLAVDLSSCTEP